MRLLIFEVNPLNPPPGGSSGGEGGYFGGRCVVTTNLELLSSNLVCKPHYIWVRILIFEVKSPHSPKGGSSGEGGLVFGVNGFVATFLKLLSSNLVCKPYLGTNFDF